MMTFYLTKYINSFSIPEIDENEDIAETIEYQLSDTELRDTLIIVISDKYFHGILHNEIRKMLEDLDDDYNLCETYREEITEYLNNNLDL